MTRRVAILGAGIGAQHVEGFQALPDRFEVTTICDLDQARGEALAALCPGAGWSDNIRTVLADPTIDIVDICLPPHLHFPTCLAALDAGKDVICEKPLVGSLREADLLAARIADTGRHVFPVFQYRFGLGTAQFHALEKAGLLGKPHVATLETHWNRGADYYAVPWRGKWQQEQGGAILGHAIHAHDLMTALLGPVASVQARTATRVNPIETEDCAAVVFIMENGALVTSSVTLGAARDMSRLRLVFEKATVESDQAPYAPARKAWTFTARDPRDQPAIDAVLAGATNAAPGYAGLFAALADALDGQPGREVAFEDGRRSLELVTAIYASAREGETVSLPIPPSHPLYGSWLP